MHLDSTTIFIIFLMFLIAYASYSANKAKNNIYCMFIRADKTWINKWAKPKQRRIVFDNGWYYLNSKRMISRVLEDGIYKLFPQKVHAQIFRWNSSNPLNPDDFTQTWETPESRKNLNKEEDIRDLMVGNVQALGTKKKKGMIEGLMPILTVVGFVIVGYLLYTVMKKQDMLGNALNIIQQMLMNK